MEWIPPFLLVGATPGRQVPYPGLPQHAAEGLRVS